MDEAHWFTGWQSRKADFQQRCRDEKLRFLAELESPHKAQEEVLKDRKRRARAALDLATMRRQSSSHYLNGGNYFDIRKIALGQS